MLSVASVRSASGAANYFAKDDYYVGEQSSEISLWGGIGAAELGLSGEVSKDDFEKILNGEQPDGNMVGQVENRRAGMDLTFSMSKSASVLAYVGGDERLLAAHLQAVQKTMAWVEKHFAEGRVYTDGNPKGEAVKTGNLTYAIFQHDTSRALDPQAHLHVVVANMTKVGEKWQALHNGELWKNNSIIGSVYHAALRQGVEKLGYETEATGKHGQFEIKGVPKAVIKEFSQRRETILEKVEEAGITTPRGQDAVVVNTRDKKTNLDDRDTLRAEWGDRSASHGFDAKAMVEAARENSLKLDDPNRPIGTLDRLTNLGTEIRERVGNVLLPSDPLTRNGIDRLGITPAHFRTEMAVASAIRIMGDKEAAFPIHQISKTALDLGLKDVTIDGVEARVRELVRDGQVVLGTSTRSDGTITHATTPEHIRQEMSLIDGIRAGKDQATPLISAGDATVALQAKSAAMPLDKEQLGAATLALTSSDRTIVVQGVAGAGKTTMVTAMSEVAADQGKKVLGLAFANKMVNKLADETGIKAQTVSSFVNEHLKGAIAGTGPQFDASKAALKDTVLLLDEASLVANKPMNDLLTIANRLGLDRLVLMGDRSQLQPINAGKAFTVIQERSGAQRSQLDTSHRQRTDDMKAVATLSRTGNFKEAFEVLGERVVSAGTDHLQRAAGDWLARSPEDRDRTAVFTSGRDARAQINEMIQTGLKAEGALGGASLTVTSLQQVNLSPEEMRYAKNYAAGQILDVMGRSRPGGLYEGRYEVLGTSQDGKVSLLNNNGKIISFSPDRIDPKDKREPLAIYEKEQTTLHEGDKVVYGSNDKDRGIARSADAKILDITPDAVTVLNKDGTIVTLGHDDKHIERLGLAYAINMHQAQGMTTDLAIGAMHSSERNLSTERLTHVMATRVRDDITIYTNDRDQLLRTIEANSGDKLSALDTIDAGKANPTPEPSTTAPEPLRKDPSLDPASLRMDPEKHLGPQIRNQPERSIELGL